MIQCYSAEQLLRSFHIDEASGVSRSDFHRLCPALVQQAASQACQSSTKTPDDEDDTRPSDAEGNVSNRRLESVEFVSILTNT